MGKDVLDASPAARDVFARADAALGEKLSKLILEGPEAELTLTANAQPAIVTVSIAILAAIKERAPSLADPVFGAGHSLGEYSALVASGALELEDAVRLVRARGRAMQEAVPPGHGAMSAVMGVEPTELEAICKEAARSPGGGVEVVSPANFNAPGQIVIAGHASAVARAGEIVGKGKGKVIPLKVSAPFHCALMAPAARVVEDELAKVNVSASRFPIIANFDARPNSDASKTKSLLVRQVDGAVRWEATVRLMQDRGVAKALEIGPGKVLAGLVKRTSKDIKVHSVESAAAVDQVAAFLSS